MILIIHILNYAYQIIKVFNQRIEKIYQRINETRHLSWHETCACKCRLDASICNNKQRWSNDNICECECDKLCDIGQYLDYEHCNCR